MPYRIWITLLWVGSIAAVVGCSGKTPPAEAPAAFERLHRHPEEAVGMAIDWRTTAG